MPMKLVVVPIEAAAGLDPDTRRRLASALRCTGTRQIDAFERVALKLLGGHQISRAVERVEAACLALANSNCFTIETAYSEYRAAITALEELKRREPVLSNFVAALVAEMREKGLLVHVERGRWRPCDYFPCQAVDTV